MDNTFIKDFILDLDFLSADQIKKAEELIFQKEIDFSDALLELGFLDQETLLQVTAAFMGLTKVDLDDKVITLENYRVIPEPISQKEKIICFNQTDESIFIAFCDSKALEVLDGIVPQNKKLKLF